MTKEEFLKELDYLENRIKEITKEYLKENAIFRVGDVIITRDEEIGKITRFTHNGDGFISADWCKMKKDGTFRTKDTHISHWRLYNSKLFNK